MIETKKRVLCAHLYDDFSGSSKVMAQAIAALSRHGHEVVALVGSRGDTGFIRQSHQVVLFKNRSAGSRLRMLASFCAAQMRLLITTWRHCRSWRPNVVYVNTVLPVGAVVAAVLCGVPVVVHAHEVGLGSPMLFRLLIRFVDFGADRIICVSNYVADSLPLRKDRMLVILNALTPHEEAIARRIAACRDGTVSPRPFTVLMACSLKIYKGVDSFVEIARRLQSANIRFKLLANCEAQEVDKFFLHQRLPENLEIVRRPKSVFDHYRSADLLVNLSHREAWIESFGLTLLEAMTCALPVIAPTVGGCTELLEDGQGGWFIDSRDFDALCSRILALARDPQMWAEASSAAAISAARFSDEKFAYQLDNAISVFHDRPRTQ